MQTFIALIESGGVSGHPAVSIVGPFQGTEDAEQYLADHRTEPIDGGYYDAHIINEDTAVSPEQHKADEGRLAR